MESHKMLVGLLVCTSGLLDLASAVATSHQSMVSGDGWRYSYGIVHAPHGEGAVSGESYPHGYGGFGTYAPSYSYDDFHHDVPHALPVPAVHAPLHLPASHPSPVPVLHSTHLPSPYHPAAYVPSHFEPKPLAAPEYVLPSYLAGAHYGGGYLDENQYGDALAHYYDDHDDQFLQTYGDALLADHSLYADYLGEHHNAHYKPKYNDYYAPTSYHY